MLFLFGALSVITEADELGVVSFCKAEVCIGEADVLLAASPREDVRGDTRPFYIPKSAKYNHEVKKKNDSMMALYENSAHDR